MVLSEKYFFILFLYYASERTPRIAADLFEAECDYRLSEATIKNAWKNSGLEIQKHGGYRHGLEREKFIKLYKKHNGDMKSMLDETGFSRSRLSNKCYEEGLSWIN